jgi:FtsP/CotA-like multicopper oxidase with cupredoxin domain
VFRDRLLAADSVRNTISFSGTGYNSVPGFFDFGIAKLFSQMSYICQSLFAASLFVLSATLSLAQTQNKNPEVCPRPLAETALPEPEDLRSENGVLKVDLSFRNEVDAQGRTRYCYIYRGGIESPNLRLHPGDLLILTLSNELTATSTRQSAMVMGKSADSHASTESNPCVGTKMTAVSTNLHFHGLTIPAVCHQDDVLKTTIQPSDAPFEYRFRIPQDQPPGLYWYHPHLHGFTRTQVMGGASGALIVEGIEQANREVARLPERVFVIRDEDLLNPNAVPKGGGQQAPPAVLDRDGDARNTGDGSGKPAKDLSVNFVSSPYPDYQGGLIEMKPSERQFWRVVNASSITYLNLQLLVGGKPQMFGIVGVDGVPINVTGGTYVVWQNHLGIPPGGRSEFLVQGPPAGADATLITRSVNTGPGGENDPTRTIAKIVATEMAADPKSKLGTPTTVASSSNVPWLGNVQPVRTRRLYFSEKLEDPKDPNSPTTFYLTVEGQTPTPFDPRSTEPNIVVHQGDVEDWIVENRSQEVHDFHIHQVHFLMLEWFGIPINEPFLRDTVPVPFWDGKAAQYPTVKLRMDFRDPSAIGLFPYHCHLLEHEDGGMMGLIQVEPLSQGRRRSSKYRKAR